MWSYICCKCLINFLMFHTIILQTMQSVPSNVASCWWGLFASFRYLTARSKASTAVAMATATWCTDIPVSSSTAMLTYMSVLNPLLRTPAQTHVLEFNCLPYLQGRFQHTSVYELSCKYTYDTWVQMRINVMIQR